MPICLSIRHPPIHLLPTRALGLYAADADAGTGTGAAAAAHGAADAAFGDAAFGDAANNLGASTFGTSFGAADGAAEGAARAPTSAPPMARPRAYSLGRSSLDAWGGVQTNMQVVECNTYIALLKAKQSIHTITMNKNLQKL